MNCGGVHGVRGGERFDPARCARSICPSRRPGTHRGEPVACFPTPNLKIVIGPSPWRRSLVIPQIVRMLLDAGEDPNRYNPVGAHSHSTPLHQAAVGGHAGRCPPSCGTRRKTGCGRTPCGRPRLPSGQDMKAAPKLRNTFARKKPRRRSKTEAEPASDEAGGGFRTAWAKAFR